MTILDGKVHTMASISAWKCEKNTDVGSDRRLSDKVDILPCKQEHVLPETTC